MELNVSDLKAELDRIGLWYPPRATLSVLRACAEKHLVWKKKFAFFDEMSNDIIVLLGKCLLDWSSVCKLAATCKRLNSLLSHNSVWHWRSKELDGYDQLPKPWKVSGAAPDGYWKSWFLDHVPRSTIVIPPCHVSYRSRGCVHNVFMPEIGSLLGTHPHGNRFGAAPDLVAWICVDVTKYSRGQNKDLPKTITVAPVKQAMGYCLANRRCDYTIEDRVTLKTSETGRFGSHTVIQLTYYTNE